MAPIVGFWGEPTSTLDWCEENYASTRYIAEFWNTISNLAMIIPSIGGLYYANKNRLEMRIKLCFIALALVGVGSWNFHMTLRYHMQLFDELPMLWGSLMLVYVLITHLYEVFEDKRSWHNFYLMSGLISYGAISTAIYLHFKTPILFQASYGILVAFMVYLDVCIVKSKPCCVGIFYAAVGCYHGGFALWLVDNFCCDLLRELRAYVLPVLITPLTQLHAHWHCLAGLGAYLHILFGAHSRNLAKGRTLRLKWVWFGVVLDDEDAIAADRKQD